MARALMFSGEGVNLKTGKMIKFHVPQGISSLGLETVYKNINIDADTVTFPPITPEQLEKMKTTMRSAMKGHSEIYRMHETFRPISVPYVYVPYGYMPVIDVKDK